jgi:hypothetical protein
MELLNRAVAISPAVQCRRPGNRRRQWSPVSNSSLLVVTVVILHAHMPQSNEGSCIGLFTQIPPFQLPHDNDSNLMPGSARVSTFTSDLTGFLAWHLLGNWLHHTSLHNTVTATAAAHHYRSKCRPRSILCTA